MSWWSNLLAGASSFIPGVGPIVAPIIAGVGGALGNKSQTTTQQQQQNQNSTTSGTNQGNNTYYNQTRQGYSDPMSGQYNAQALQQAMARVNQGVVDPRQYAESQVTGNIQNLNNQAALQRKVIENVMRQKGLAYSPMGGTMLANADANRVQQGIGYANQLPQLERQAALENETIQNQRQQLLQSLLGQQLTNQEREGFENTWNSNNSTTTGQSNMTGSNTTPSNMMAGGFQSLATMLANLYGRGAFGGGSGGSGQGIPYNVDGGY